jgi:23S rRNA pseudouridine1911/1915/1917 synthase
LLEFHPHTGRTHQIRLHCELLGCPIVGDEVYGKKKPTITLNRHFLHASRLKIILPGEKEQRLFEAELPEELVSVLNTLRGEE